MAQQPPKSTPSRLNYDQSSKAIQSRAEPSTAMVQVGNHKAYLDARLAKIKEWVRHGVSPESLIRFTLRDMSDARGQKLRECTQESIYLGLLACAVTGLEPGALKGEAYLVPYRDNKRGVTEATFMPGYRGIIKQARQSREVTAIWSNVVYDGDEFEVDLGSANRIVHKPSLTARAANPEIIAAYAIARMAAGQDEIEVMDRQDLDAIRKAGNDSPAWQSWPDQMYRKAPIRRLGKRLPLGPDYFVALALDGGDSSTPLTAADQRRILDVEIGGEASRIEAGTVAAAEMGSQISDAELAKHDAELNAKEGNE